MHRWSCFNHNENQHHQGINKNQERLVSLCQHIQEVVTALDCTASGFAQVHGWMCVFPNMGLSKNGRLIMAMTRWLVGTTGTTMNGQPHIEIPTHGKHTNSRGHYRRPSNMPSPQITSTEDCRNLQPTDEESMRC